MIYNTNTLQLNKILENLKNYSYSDITKNNFLNLNPIYNYDKIIQMQLEVLDAYNIIIKNQPISFLNILNKKDSILRASIGGILSIKELNDIANFLYLITVVKKEEQILINNKISYDNLDKYFSNLISNDKLLTEIRKVITPDLLVSDTASDRLAGIRHGIKVHENRLRQKINELLTKHASNLTEPLIVLRSNRLCLPFKVEYKNQVKGIIHDESASKTTVYIEPQECVLINITIESLRNEEKTEIEAILRQLSSVVGSFEHDLSNSLYNLVCLDMIFSKALYAIDTSSIMPKINNDGYINLIQARHPLLKKEEVVPIDITLGEDYKTIIITGPNTGGKTVVLKTVGLLTAMMQCGLFIPANNGSTLSIFENIFVDIGDEQSIEQSLSTFSSHMTKIKYILENKNDSSLVLLDELGSGTDPKEGACLAISIIDDLKKSYCTTIATTHYSMLKEYAYSNDDVSNASVLFDVETLKPTYKLQVGIPGKSNAFLISQRLGLSKHILNHASNLYDTTSTDQEKLLLQLDIENEKISNTKKEYEHIISEYNLKLKTLEGEFDKLEKQKEAILNKATLEANKIIEETKEKSSVLLDKLKSIKESNLKEHEIADIKYQARSLKVNKVKEEEKVKKLFIGDYVFVSSYNQVGVITNIKKDKYEVQIGQFKMFFDIKELKASKSPVKKVVKKVKKVNVVSNKSDAKMQLDLRGFRYEEVHEAIDLFIDKAYLANIPVINIVHGYGSGAVRDAVYKYLKSSTYVKDYRFGGEGEGLNGATVVYLK